MGRNRHPSTSLSQAGSLARTLSPGVSRELFSGLFSAGAKSSQLMAPKITPCGPRMLGGFLLAALPRSPNDKLGTILTHR